MSINRQLDVAACLDAKRNFTAYDGMTFCNVYAAVFLGLRGHVIPLNMTANALFDWFKSPKAVALGWRAATEADAVAVANSGGDVVAVAKAEPHGHIGVVVESLPGVSGPCVSAAGRENFIRAPLKRSFGDLKPTYYVNLGACL